MNDPIWVPIIGGAIFSLLTVSFLVTAVVIRKSPLKEERGKHGLLTVFPFSIRYGGITYVGPFSRLSLYSDMLVIRALGVSCTISRSDCVGTPELHGAWLVIMAHVDGQKREIEIAADNNPGLRDNLRVWMDTGDIR